ncbi:MAG: DoxX family membrane protein [bacterium]|nr:DoxX family membrane protein [bacterium]
MTYFTNESVLYFTLRVILGILFFFQGYDKLFKLKIKGVIEFFHEEMRGKNVPSFLLSLSAYFTSLIEFFAGGLLILGLFKTYALCFLGVDLILVCGAFSMMKPMWDMQLLFPRLAILSVLLYLPGNWDLLSLDQLILQFLK